ncbi:hypothetical protein HRbin21_01496 [bacterium HR21]|nr:hypothetical protein HRbin21_01496 [bacterium HR21]
MTSAKIADGTITDADISSSAAIAVSKLAPGSNDQVLTTVGGVPTWSNVSTVETDPQVGTLTNGQIAFWSGTALTGNNALFWDNTNERLGIGTSTPQTKLHVHGSAVQITSSSTGSGSTNGFIIRLNGTHAQLVQNENAEIQFRTNASGGSDTVKMRLTADGKLLFFDPTNGAQYRIDLPNNTAIGVGLARSRGWVLYSSQRWKEDIVTLPNALETVLRLRGVSFRWKPEYGGNHDIGFIAEEVGEVLPEVVQRDPKTGEYLGMDYMRVVPVLVEALKEEHRRVEELRSEVAQLRSLVEQLVRERGERGGGGQGVEVHDAWLGQNIPNPFEGTTTIPYYIPAGVSRAELVVRDLGGRELRRIELSERGAHGQVRLEMRLLGSGTYEYALVLDGRVVATRQMTLVR